MTLLSRDAGTIRVSRLLIGACVATALSTGPETIPQKDVLEPGLLASPSDAPMRRSWEHGYRVNGRAWLVVWVTRSNVAAVRLARRETEGASTMAFLAASRPEGTPEGAAQWGYDLEHSDGVAARSFIVRTFTQADSVEPEVRLAEGTGPVLSGATCESIQRDSSRASLTGFRVPPPVNLRRFGLVLEALDRARHWQTVDTSPPADVSAGFFSALQSLLEESVMRARGAAPVRPLRRTYMFRGRVFDMTLDRFERTTPDRLKGRFTYRNRVTREGDDFSVTFGSRGELAGVPVEMSFAPSWWIRVHLVLDDAVDVPADPATDGPIAERIDGICRRALATDVPQP